MNKKICRTCGENKELSEYYKHKAMWDGHLNKCKECVKNRVSKHRDKNIDRVREYDRNRHNAKERSIKNSERLKSLPSHKKEEYRVVKEKWTQRQENKNKKTVNLYMANAVRDGRLKKLDYCEHCNAKDIPLDGHHHSYLKPLDVTWLCKPCHSAEHKRLNAVERGSK